jgi:hypothetical protein
MREIFTTGRFDKRLTAFIHRHPELNAETRSVMELIAKDPAHPRCARISSRDRSPSASHLGSLASTASFLYSTPSASFSWTSGRTMTCTGSGAHPGVPTINVFNMDRHTAP